MAVSAVWITNSRNGGGTYDLTFPWRIVLHTIEGSASPGMIAGHPYPPLELVQDSELTERLARCDVVDGGRFGLRVVVAEHSVDTIDLDAGTPQPRRLVHPNALVDRCGPRVVLHPVGAVETHVRYSQVGTSVVERGPVGVIDLRVGSEAHPIGDHPVHVDRRLRGSRGAANSAVPDDAERPLVDRIDKGEAAMRKRDMDPVSVLERFKSRKLRSTHVSNNTTRYGA